MKSFLSLIIAVATAACVAPTALAGPKDWLGKELPALGVEFLGSTPETKGKAQIVEFWATWCPPCRASIPHLNEIHKKFKDKGLVVMGITDETKDKVEKFRKNLPMDYHVAVGGDKIQAAIGIQGIPHAFIVGKDGKVIWEGHPMRMKDAEIEKALQ